MVVVECELLLLLVILCLQALYNRQGFSWIDIWCVIWIKPIWSVEAWVVCDICDINTWKGTYFFCMITHTDFACPLESPFYLFVFFNKLQQTQVHKAVDACKSVLRGLHSNQIAPRELDRVSYFLKWSWLDSYNFQSSTFHLLTFV